MVRLLIALLFVLSGCAGPQSGFGSFSGSWPFASSKGRQPATSSPAGGYAQFNFDWQLSGDREIMPLQVFDDGLSLWLQFPAEGAWPAVFEAAAEGLRPLAYRREPPYMVLDGVPDRLELRGGHLRGVVQRAAGAGPAAAPSPSLQAELPMATVPVAAEPLTEAVPGTTLEPPPVTPPRRADFLGAPLTRYAVSPADITMRQALERWARSAGWTFSAEHWAVDVDIPLVGEASFETDFKSAVRELLAATEMGDRPLQPCFYSNQVLRVVHHAQVCDRRGAGRAAA